MKDRTAEKKYPWLCNNCQSSGFCQKQEQINLQQVVAAQEVEKEQRLEEKARIIQVSDNLIQTYQQTAKDWGCKLVN